MDSYVKRIEDGWDDTKKKAQTRLDLLNNTKSAWNGYGQGLEDIAAMFEQAEDEMTKIKKRYNLQAAKDDLAKRYDNYFLNTLYYNVQPDRFASNVSPK